MIKNERDSYIVFGKPSLREEEIQAVSQTLRSGWIGTGPMVKQFEGDFAKYIGAQHAAAVSSCTAALELVLRAYGIGPGDEVITTPMTFAATVNAIVHAGAMPVLADVDRKTFNLDPSRVASLITKKTKAVIPVHFAGSPVDMDAFLTLRSKHGFKLIQDCAHAIETEWRGKRVGAYPDASCFSFYSTKNITTIEGGMVCSDDAELIDRIRVLGNHGMSKDAWKRFSAGGYRHYDVVEHGFKYNMTDTQATLGVCQLQKVEEFKKLRQQAWATYQQAFAKTSFVKPVEQVGSGNLHALHLYTVLVDRENSGRDRDDWLQQMHARGIGCGVHYRSIPRLEVFGKLGYKPSDFPNSDWIGERTLSLPLTQYLTAEQLKRVIEAVHELDHSSTL